MYSRSHIFNIYKIQVSVMKPIIAGVAGRPQCYIWQKHSIIVNWKQSKHEIF